MIANHVTNTCKSQLKIPPGVWDSRHGFQSVPAVAILRLCQPLLPAQNSAGLAAACSRAEPLMKPGSWMADSGSLPLSIGFVPFRVAFDKIQAQQTPAGFQPGFGFDAAREKFQEVDEAGEQGIFHYWLFRSQYSQGKINWNIL
jgi:hypothetical protein